MDESEIKPFLSNEIINHSIEESDTEQDDGPLFSQCTFPLVRLTFLAALGGFLFGYDTGVISGALLYIGDDFALTALTKELIVSATVLGAIFGAGIAAPTSKRFGRKRILMVSDIVFVVGAACMAAAPALWLLIAGRFVVGLGIGLASMLVPMYLSEVAPLRYRGMLVTINVALITLGQFISYGVDAALSAAPGNWRWMLGLSAVPALVQLLGMEFLPESPRWFLFHGREPDALHAWREIRRGLPSAAGEFERVKAEVAQQQRVQARVSWSDIWSDAGSRRAVLVGSMLQVFQQFVGINTVMYYSPTIVQMTGLGSGSNQTAILSSMAIAGANSVMTLLALPVIDRFGRRVLILASLAGTFLALLVLAVSFWSVVALPWLSLFGLVFYTLMFAPGMGPVPWAINAEIYPLSVREKGNAIATMANWVSNLVMSLTFLSISDALSPTGAFLIYAIIALLGIAFIILFVPETRNRTIDQISWYFNNPSVDPAIFHEPFSTCRPPIDSPYF